MQEVGDFISTVGFPVAVAAFLLIKMNGKLQRLTDSIEKLIRSLDRHLKDREGDE